MVGPSCSTSTRYGNPCEGPESPRKWWRGCRLHCLLPVAVGGRQPFVPKPTFPITLLGHRGGGRPPTPATVRAGPLYQFRSILPRHYALRPGRHVPQLSNFSFRLSTRSFKDEIVKPAGRGPPPSAVFAAARTSATVFPSNEVPVPLMTTVP